MEYFTKQTNFFGKTDPYQLTSEFGSPLYVYNESILRLRCREMKSLIQLPNAIVNYSTKANSNIELLKIIHSEGLHADAMSPGEIYVLLAAGFSPNEIFYISNYVSEEEMLYAINKNITISVDSVSQLKMYGRINPGGKVAVRFNPGIGAGHHEKVITGGKKTKFGINGDQIDEVKAVLREYNLKIIGINQHIGSLFMHGEPYIDGVTSLLKIAEQFEGLEFIDLGGGFGIPYHKQDNEPRLELKDFGSKLSEMLSKWAASYDNSNIIFKIEPGRYIVAECGILLGTVHAIKINHETVYAGTDIGFNTLVRPIMYDSHHDIEVYKKNDCNDKKQKYTIVGNICESGDVIAKDRTLPSLAENDVIGVLDAGAYGYSMSSNYNNRLRPAEVLICESSQMPRLIRRRDTLEDLLRNFERIPQGIA